MLEQADSRASLGFEGYGKFDPSNSGVRGWKVRGDIVTWSPLQSVCPFSKRLPMVVWHIVFGVPLVLAEVGDDSAVHCGVVVWWWLDGGVSALGEGWWRGGPSVPWRLPFEILH